MTRPKFLFSLLLLGVIATSASAVERPHKGKMLGRFLPIGQVGSVVTFSGLQIGEMTHMGRSKIQSTHTADLSNGTGSGTYTHRAADGSTVVGMFSIGPLPSGQLIGSWKITDGSGRFSGATGSGTMLITPVSNIDFIVEYSGKIDF